MSPRLMLAAPASGSGKTTLTVGLVGAFRRLGLAVQPFKCGPDYIDPGYHTQAAGRPCRNLDTWLLDREQVRTLFAYTSADADITLIEGVMGLFDGFGALDQRGSSADVARLLETPVVLIVDASGMASSVAALVDGFRNFDPQVRIGGVLLNRMGSARHA
ncbi:MAG: cobyrinate a,c-diamide synthase, partial [Chloroflexota bacterium]